MFSIELIFVYKCMCDLQYFMAGLFNVLYSIEDMCLNGLLQNW